MNAIPIEHFEIDPDANEILRIFTHPDGRIFAAVNSPVFQQMPDPAQIGTMMASIGNECLRRYPEDSRWAAETRLREAWEKGWSK